MKPGRPPKLSVGWIIVDIILIAGTIRDIYTGRLPLNKWCIIVVASAILGILFVKVYKKRIEQERKQFESTKEEDHSNPDTHKEN